MRQGRGVLVALPLLLAPLACHRASHPETGARAPCASLEKTACERARALTAAAATYADESHDYVLASRALSSAAALAQTKDGWRPLPTACARARTSAPKLDTAAVDYAFVGVTVDGTLVSADADVGPLLARAEPKVHDVRLVAVAFVRDLAPPSFDPGTDLIETASGGCSCGDATHFAGATRYGAMTSFAFEAPRDAGGWLAHEAPHVRALDFVRGALGDARRAVHETRVGGMTIDGLPRFLAHDATAPLVFHVTDAQPIAYAATPIAELCDFPTPEVSPSPLDFGVAPYGTEVRRSVHVVNRAPIDLRALLGASTFVLPAGGAIDLPLRWTPEGDAPGCETQTRDEAIPFLRLRGETARTARVLETVRTGRPSVARKERVEPVAPKLDLASTSRDWSCPRDFARTACRAENAGSYDVVAEPRGEDACHFACRGPAAPGRPVLCHFDAVMECALRCPP